MKYSITNSEAKYGLTFVPMPGRPSIELTEEQYNSYRRTIDEFNVWQWRLYNAWNEYFFSDEYRQHLFGE